MDPALALEIEVLSQQRAVDQLIERGDSDIQQFYKDAVIFMSGGSGFIGKQLIEKLFRSCNVIKIYILLRPKKQKTIEQRLAEFVKEPVFDNLRKTQPDFSEKLEALAGDIYELRLGMSDSNWNTVTEEANIIFHVAASISFVEPIKTATLTNVRGTREMLALGKACKKLRSYVHVSTAYAHATYSRIDQPVLEQFYPSPVPPTTMIEFAESVDQTVLDDITPQMIKPWPNTYTFTKAIAEEAVRTMAGDLPICIVRPATETVTDIINNSLYYKYPSDKALWANFGTAINNDVLYVVLFWFLHFIPAYLIDVILKILGKRPLCEVGAFFNRPNTDHIKAPSSDNDL